MARQIPWRQRCPAEVSDRLAAVATSGLLVVQQPGPTSFVLKCPRTQAKVKVLIGTQHQCQCTEGRRELCLHILFVLAKVFRVPFDNPMLWQRSLLEAEIEQLVRGRQVMLLARQAPPSGGDSGGGGSGGSGDSTPCVPRRPIEAGDTCPICCDDLLPPAAAAAAGDRRPLVHCRFGCGNSIHTTCFKAYAIHNSTNPTPLQCPLCRCKWGDLASTFGDDSSAAGEGKTAFGAKRLIENSHGVGCSHCRQIVAGERYRCAYCAAFDLCAACAADPLVHPQHPFDVSLGPGLAFQPATRPTRRALPGAVEANNNRNGGEEGGGGADPGVAALVHREIGPEDYEALLALDDGAPPRSGDVLTEVELSRLPHLQYTPGACEDTECAICLAAFERGDILIGLPQCAHVFHAACAATWLMRSHARCPVDNSEVPRLVAPTASASGATEQPRRSGGGGGGGGDGGMPRGANARAQQRQQQQQRRTTGTDLRAAAAGPPPPPLMLEPSVVGLHRRPPPSASGGAATDEERSIAGGSRIPPRQQRSVSRGAPTRPVRGRRSAARHADAAVAPQVSASLVVAASAFGASAQPHGEAPAPAGETGPGAAAITGRGRQASLRTEAGSGKRGGDAASNQRTEPARGPPMPPPPPPSRPRRHPQRRDSPPQRDRSELFVGLSAAAAAGVDAAAAGERSAVVMPLGGRPRLRSTNTAP